MIVVFVRGAEDEIFGEGITLCVSQLTKPDVLLQNCGDSDLEACRIQSCSCGDCEGARSAGIDDDEVKVFHRG